MNGIFCFGLDWASLIDGVANNVHDSSKSFGSNRDSDWSSGIIDLLSSD